MDVQLASPFSLSSYNPQLAVSLLVHGAALGPRSAAAWPSANRAIFIPVPVDGFFTIKKFACENGTVSGNLDLGVYTAEGQLVVSTGSTAMSGAGVWQVIDVTDTTIPPGLYYLAMAVSNSTATFASSSLGLNPTRGAGIANMNSAFPLPATATLAAPVTSYLPSCQAMAVDTL